MRAFCTPKANFFDRLRIHPYSCQNFGGVLLEKNPWCMGSREKKVQAHQPWNYFRSISTSVTKYNRQTDWRMTDGLVVALRSA